MKTQTTENQIMEYGWEVETIAGIVTNRPPGRFIHTPPDMFRGSSGGFKTMWRSTLEEVLKDVEAICKARKDPANQRVPF